MMMLDALKFLSALIFPALIGCSPQVTTSSGVVADKNAVKGVVASHLKPGAGVSFENNASYVLQQSVPGDIVIVLLAAEAEGVMDVRISVSDELILNSTNNAQFQLLPNGRYELPISVTAYQQGRHYINLQVLTTVNKRQASRVLSAIVQVGDEAHLQKNQGFAFSSAVGEGVISMPAQETIIP